MTSKMKEITYEELSTLPKDAYKLIDKFVASVDAPVCVAGSINSYERLDEIKKINPASFTIGSAFFNQCFGSDFGAQIDTVCSYMEQ